METRILYHCILRWRDGVRLERALLREKQQKNPNYAELCGNVIWQMRKIFR